VKAADNQIVVLDSLALEAPKTKSISSMLLHLDIKSSTLILLPESNPAVESSIRNLEGVQYLRAQYLNVRDLLNFEFVLLPASALEVIEGMLG
jgi:large subunit ribosomal protein L4